MEVRGQVKEGGGEEEEEEQYALGRTLAPNKVSFWMLGSQWRDSISPLSHLSPPQPWAGPRQRICPHAPPAAGPFSSRAWGGELRRWDSFSSSKANPVHSAPSTRAVNRVGRM